MRWLRRWRAAVRRWRAGDLVERDVHAEWRSYVELLTEDHRRSGLSEPDARRLALIEAEGSAQVAVDVRQGRVEAGVDQVVADVRYAVRGLLRAPSFAVAAIATLALGMAVTVVAFSVVDAAAFRPLPYSHPEELVYVRHVLDPRSVDDALTSMTWEEWHLWRDEHQLFSEAMAWTFPQERHWTDRDRSLWIGRMTTGVPSALGVAPLAGRLFTPEEANRREPVLLLSEAVWTREFGRALSVLGRRLTIDDVAYTVIGVMPKALRFGPGAEGRADGWLPLNDHADTGTGDSGAAITAFRLQRGVSFQAAQQSVGPVGARIQSAVPTEHGAWTARLSRLADDRSATQGRLHRWLMALWGLSVAVLMVGCANIANLLVVRANTRAGELALRTALGATPARVIRLLVTEGIVLSAVAAGLALLLARLGITIILERLPPLLRQTMFEAAEPVVGGRVLAYCLAAGVGSALLAGLWPVWRIRPHVVADARATPPGGRRLDTVVQAAQAAVAFVVVCSAVTMSVSFYRTVQHDLGFDADRIGWMSLVGSGGRSLPADALQTRLADVLATARAVPGVAAAAFGQSPLLPVLTDLRRADAFQTDVRRNADMRVGIGPGYFEVLGIRVLQGRGFVDADTTSSDLVAVLDESASRSLFADASALDHRVRLGRQGATYRVVGIVNDAATSDFNRVTRIGSIYLPVGQPPAATAAFLQIRANVGVDVGSVLAAVSHAVTRMPDVRPVAVWTTADFLASEETFSVPRFYLIVTGTFAALALVVCGIGVFGMLAFGARRRRREFSVRLALGASVWRVRWEIVRTVVVPVSIGLAAGLVVWWAVVRAGVPALFGVVPGSAEVTSIGAALTATAAALACVAPLRLVRSADTIEALRFE